MNASSIPAIPLSHPPIRGLPDIEALERQLGRHAEPNPELRAS